MNITITEKDAGAPLIQVDENAVRLISRFGLGVFRPHCGKGFAYWDNQYRFSADTVLAAQGEQPVLELHITRRGIWKGSWEGVSATDAHPWQFNLSYTPHVNTRFLFRADRFYQSSDLHFDFGYLETLAPDFAALDVFLESVTRRTACDLSAHNHSCTREMMTLAAGLPGVAGSPDLLDLNVRQLLIAALEKISLDTGRSLPVITGRQVEGLHYAKVLIDELESEPLALKTLALQTGLNEYSLKHGFQLLFGISPYAYHVEQKMKRAKRLLLNTKMDIAAIAYDLGYAQSSSFGHEFRKLFGVSPGVYRKQQKPV